jgi:hypothetical protein
MDAVLRILQLYKFDLGDRSLTSISIKWRNYDLHWLRSAITESIYRGRYKVISVEQILESWQRKQEVFSKFDDEFENLIWGNLGLNLADPEQNQISSNLGFEVNTDNSLAMIKKLKSLCQT